MKKKQSIPTDSVKKGPHSEPSPVKQAISFKWSSTSKPVLHSLAPYQIKSIHVHYNILIIRATDGVAAVVLENEAATSEVLNRLLDGTQREIAIEDGAFGFLWDDVITGAASVAGLKRLPENIKAKIEQFGVTNHHVSPLIHTIAASVQEIGQGLGWQMVPANSTTSDKAKDLK